MCRVGDVGQAREVLAGLRGQPTATSARSIARLSLFAGDPATAEQARLRRDRLGGLLHEYVQAHEVTRFSAPIPGSARHHTTAHNQPILIKGSC